MSPTMWEDAFPAEMGWLLIEFPGFSRSRADYFPNDEAYAAAQSELANNPRAGDAMPGCGGVRKLRLPDRRRGKGKRGGLRLIYLQLSEARVIVLLDVYDKNEKDDLTAEEKKAVRILAAEIKAEIIVRFEKEKGS